MISNPFSLCSRCSQISFCGTAIRSVASLLAVLSLAQNSATACWSGDSVVIEKQLASTTSWGVIQVLGFRFSGLRSAPNVPLKERTGTWVQFVWTDINGVSGKLDEFWFEGADTEGGLHVSSMPHLIAGRHYVALLAEDKTGRLRPVADAASFMAIESGDIGTLSPWDPVQTEGRGVVPAGASATVSDAQLFEVIDIITAAEQRVRAETAK